MGGNNGDSQRRGWAEGCGRAGVISFRSAREICRGAEPRRHASSGAPRGEGVGEGADPRRPPPPPPPTPSAMVAARCIGARAGRASWICMTNRERPRGRNGKGRGGVAVAAGAGGGTS